MVVSKSGWVSLATSLGSLSSGHISQSLNIYSVSKALVRGGGMPWCPLELYLLWVLDAEFFLQRAGSAWRVIGHHQAMESADIADSIIFGYNPATSILN